MTFLKREPPQEADRGVLEAEVIRLLRSIDSRLALLGAPHEQDIRRRLAAEVLRAGGRVAMWDAIDGVKTSGDLAKVARVSNRFAQMFVNELLSLGLVRRVDRDGGRGTVVEKDRLGIVEWYLGRGDDPPTLSSSSGRV